MAGIVGKSLKYGKLFGTESTCFCINISDSGTLFSSKSVPEKFSSVKNSPKASQNIQEFQASQKSKFSPQRNRETSSQRVAQKANPSQTGALFNSGFMSDQGSRQANSYNSVSKPSDAHATMYDGHNPVSLSSVMQSNVPSPYKMKDQKNSAHLNMPGGQWGQDDKYISSERIEAKGIGGKGKVPLTASLRFPLRVACLEVKCWSMNEIISKSFHSTCWHFQRANEEESSKEALSQKERLKLAVKQYGSIVIVFHIAIALTSLGICYLLVSSGLDVSGLLNKLGINLSSLENRGSDGTPMENEIDIDKNIASAGNMSTAVGVSTFVIAYALHKVFAPVRIGITLTSAPLIVRYLRKTGIMKPPKG